MSPIDAFTEALYRAGAPYDREGDIVTVRGHGVYLSGLTSLPEGVTFSNGGYVDLSGLTEELQTYQGKQIRLRNVDGYTMLILSERSSHGIVISHCAYFRGGDLDKLKRSYVASQGEYSAHGGTIEKALRDLRFKQMEHDFDQDELVAEIRERGTVYFNDFRLLTGACEEGTQEGMAAAGLDPNADELPLDVVLSAAHGSYGERFKALFMEGSGVMRLTAPAGDF